MTIQTGDLQALDEQLATLEDSLGGAASMTAAFEGELAKMRDSLTTTGRQVDTMSKGVSRGLKRAFDGLVFDGLKLSDALQRVAKSMVNTAYSAAVRPVANHFGGLIANGINGLVQGALPFEKGGTFSQGRVMPFARGGVVSGPTNFAMRGATGLMGEAGPEAIMPLTRGPDGRLGVQAAGGGRAINVVMNITTPDVEGFRRSQSQIAAQMDRVLSRGQRNR